MEDWVDFVRDVLAPEQKMVMQHHLDTGCARCSKNLQLWRQVRTLAAHETTYHPPEEVVRFVKGSFALNRPLATRSRRTRLAQLVLDSFRQPALAGARATGQSPRQLLYRTGTLLIDLRMERLSGSRLSLVGQVLDSNVGRHDPRAPRGEGMLSGVPRKCQIDLTSDRRPTGLGCPA